MVGADLMLGLSGNQRASASATPRPKPADVTWYRAGRVKKQFARPNLLDVDRTAE
jgi:hypothetical protein